MSLYYRIYPATGRARRAATATRAREIAQSLYVRQGLVDTRPVTVCIGTGSSYRRVGEYGPWGWRSDV